MQRRLRITLAVTAAAGIAVVGAGTAQAQGVFKSDNSCTRSVDKDKPAKESDFPNDFDPEAAENANRKDVRDGHGDLYAIHPDYCHAPRPWRGNDWHDKSYDTFRYKVDPRTGYPSTDKHDNEYGDDDGYNDSFKKDKEKHLEPDHIGAPKHPQYAGH